MDQKTITLRGGPHEGEVCTIPADHILMTFPVMSPDAQPDDAVKTADYRPHPSEDGVFVFIETSSCAP